MVFLMEVKHSIKVNGKTDSLMVKVLINLMIHPNIKASSIMDYHTEGVSSQTNSSVMKGLFSKAFSMVREWSFINPERLLRDI